MKVHEAQFSFVVEKDLRVPMRDGVCLATDVYTPKNEENSETKFPTILVRTCYDKESTGLNIDCEFFAKKGFVVVVQDVRGRFKSEGSFYHGITEGRDGYDTIEWISEQPFSNGKIGMAGCSYLAAVQTAAAINKPPHFKSIFHIGGPSNYYSQWVRIGGAFYQEAATTAIFLAATSKEAASDPVVEAALLQQNISEWIFRMPLKKNLTPLRMTPEYEKWLFDMMEHSEYDEYWRKVELWSPEEYLDQHIDIPGFYISGWYDTCVPGATTLYSTMTRVKSSPQKLLIGPWIHGSFDSFAGDVDFGPEAAISPVEYNEVMLQWFNKTLKSKDYEPTQDYNVKIFVMGGGDGKKTKSGRMMHGGKWRVEREWPLARTNYTKYYVKANGILSSELTSSEESFSSFVYDPKDPVPTMGGTSNFYELIKLPGSEKRPIRYRTRMRYVLPVGAYDQRERTEFVYCKSNLPLSSRHDVLVFASPPLAEPVEVTGPLKVKLWASSSAIDTDFTSKIIDVYPPNEDYPEGYAMNLSDSIIRARYRKSFEKPEFMNPHEIYEFNIDLPPISNLFARGHLIRLDISSSNFPTFDVNRNTGRFGYELGVSVPAENRIYHDVQHPSHILLPVIPT